MEGTTDKELWLFTMRYPYGVSETFVGTELIYLCRRFRKVIIMPLIAEGTPRAIPSNAEVRHLLPEPFQAARPFSILRQWRRWNSLVADVRSSAPSREVLKRRWPDVRSAARQLLQRYLTVVRSLSKEYDPERVVLYSFWTADWTTVLALWKWSDPRVRFFGRMQGFDLYAERNEDSWPPFRKFQLKHIDRIFVTSRTGLNYLEQRYPERRGVFEYSPLGTVDHGMSPWSPSPVLRLVSNANLIPLKRVHLLAEALRLLDIPVEWTHFGDGPERVDLERIIALLPQHINVDLIGRIPYEELLANLQKKPFDLFVHTSSTEGLPLSMKEAASFGIPMLAADVGGVKEIVNEHTGILMPSDPDPALIAAHIRAHRGSAHDSMEFRVGARDWWLAHFEAEGAYGRFVDRLLDVHGGAGPARSD